MAPDVVATALRKLDFDGILENVEGIGATDRPLDTLIVCVFCESYPT